MAKLKKALPGKIDSELPDNEIVLGGKEHILQTQMIYIKKGTIILIPKVKVL